MSDDEMRAADDSAAEAGFVPAPDQGDEDGETDEVFSAESAEDEGADYDAEDDAAEYDDSDDEDGADADDDTDYLTPYDGPVLSGEILDAMTAQDPAYEPWYGPNEPGEPLAAEPELPDEPPVVRHVHSYYEATAVLGESGSLLSERRLTFEHEHSLEELHPERFDPGFGQPAGEVSEVAPFVPEKVEPVGVLIPRQPERGRSGQQGGDEHQHDHSGGRGRRGATETRQRPSQPTQAQMDSGYIMTTKSRMPARLLVRQLRAYVERERKMALDVRDAIAITYAAERYSVLNSVLGEMGPDDEVDLMKPLLTVSQAAKMLGYNAKELRRLLGQGKVSGRKVGSEWRIPLRAVL